MAAILTRRLALLLVAIYGVWSSSAAHGADAAPTQVMLVGVYHFSNPGSGIANVKAADVLAPQRQREIAAVTRALARFEPTKVGVEMSASEADEKYQKFRDGTLPEMRNESVQLGFRLARESRLTSVQGLDVGGDFPFEAFVAWARKHGRMAEIDAIMVSVKTETERISALQSRTSIGEVLRDMNSAESIARDHAPYPPSLKFGKGEVQPGVQLLSAWYTRNLGICARLLQTTAPGDRVVVFYGQGHIYLLRQCLSEQPSVRLVDPLSYLSQDSR